MPQNANQVYPSVYAGVAKPLNLDAAGNLLVADNQNAEVAVLNITSATVVKASAGYIGRVSVVVAGAAGAIYDYASTSGYAAANEIAVLPATIGLTAYDWPVSTGILVVPGAGQTISISFR